MLERQNLIAKTPQRNKTSKLCILFLTSLIYLTIAAIVGWADKAKYSSLPLLNSSLFVSFGPLSVTLPTWPARVGGTKHSPV